MQTATLRAVAAVVVFWLVEMVCQRLYFGPGASHFSTWGMTWALADTAIVLIALGLGLLLIGRVDLLARAITWTFVIGCITAPLTWFWLLPYKDYDADWLLWQAVQSAPPMGMLIWLAHGRRWRWLVGVVPALIYLGSALFTGQFTEYEALVWADDGDSSYQPLDVEALYGAQDGLLATGIAALQPQRPGKPDVFALLLGGTADQSVFLSEVEKVGPILDAQYGTEGRTLRLVNSEDNPMLYPMANRANLARALQAIGDRMGPEDLAFVFMTSHGGVGLFGLSFHQAGTGNLTAPEFATMLRDSHIGPAVIVVSSCHAGSFIPAIKAPDRLIIAAARSDRTSFGCANGRAWTEFGQSFFDTALRVEPDPRLAFVSASADVRWKEMWGLRLASHPQIEEGELIGPVLDAVLADRRSGT